MLAATDNQDCIRITGKFALQDNLYRIICLLYTRLHTPYEQITELMVFDQFTFKAALNDNFIVIWVIMTNSSLPCHSVLKPDRI